MRYIRNSALERFPASLPAFVAYCGMVSVLRPWLRRPNVPFCLAVLVPDKDMAKTYFQVAAAILGTDTRRFASDQEDNEAVLVDDAKCATDGTLRRLRRARRAIVVVMEEAFVTDDLRLIVDSVLSLHSPTGEHVAAAVHYLGSKIEMEDAEFVAQQPWERLRLAFRNNRSLAHSVKRLRAYPSAPEPEPVKVERPGPKLEELAGYGEAKEWGLELARDLADWKAGLIQWDDVDRGVLLSGPPGCGKTTFAAALAKTCDVPIVIGSAAKWQSKGHMGDMLRDMRSAFARASERAPCLLFVDEVDSFGDREKASGDNADYHRQVISGFLESLDGAESREGVVVVGACNFPNFLDAAITRPGRLDRHIRIPLPDDNDRERIFRFHLRDELKHFDIAAIVAATGGWSGADIEQAVRGARRLARRSRRAVLPSDLSNSMPPKREVSQEMRRVAAVHEAGHAVIAVLLLPDELKSVSIAQDLSLNAVVNQLGGTNLTPDADMVRTKSRYLNLIAVLLAGLAAEDLVFNTRCDGAGGIEGSDLVRATDIATSIEGLWGMGESLVSEDARDPSRLYLMRMQNPDLFRRVESLMGEQFERVRGLLIEYRTELELVADGLMERNLLSGDEVRSIVRRRNAADHSPARMAGSVRPRSMTW
ncbi:UNVERIFIED_ORG: cell division protease FtsH [Rhizobium esperanzae]|nr:cell division protease FtsH [Rhizobium esperanzae]